MTYARTISPEAALRRVVGERSEFNTMSTDPRSHYELQYTSPEAAYYVFSAGDRGCMIVSGDDRVPALLAEIPTANFDPDRLAPGAAWLLEAYRLRIASLAPDEAGTQRSALAATDNDIVALYTGWTDIAPLMECAWNQHSPYNMLCPIKTGERCLTGCVATAMAQIIRTIGYAQTSGYLYQGSGSEKVEYDYDNTPIDFANLLSSYNSLDTEESKLAVARLMLACGLSVGMSYSPSESGAYSSGVDHALINNFGYDKTHTRYLARSDFSTAKWESIIYKELSLGRPVFYSADSGVSSGHAFVIDGYRKEGLWHVNWGWGGQSDGYFSLALLSPTAVNYGDTNRGYNINQNLVKAVPPGADPGITLSSIYGSLTVASEGRYRVYYSGGGVAHEDVSLGAVIVAEGSDNILEWVPFWTNQWLGANVTVRDYKNYDFTDISLPAGEYRIYPAIISRGEETPEICAESEGLQHYVALTVTPAGKYDIHNPESSVQASTHELYLSELLTPTLYSGYQCELRYVIVNNGGADYLGTILLQLIPEGETLPVYQKTILGNVISGGFNKVMSTIFNVVDSDGRNLPAGRYNIRLTTASGEELLKEPSTETVTVVNGTPPGMHSGGGDTEVLNPSMMPEYLVKGGEWSHIPYINNERTGRIRIDLVFSPQGSNTVLERHTLYDGELGSLNGTLGFEPFTIDLPFGIYDVMYEANNINISARRRVYVGDRIDDLYYLPISADRAALCYHPDRGYSGHITVKPQITVGGSSYTVTDIIENAFSRCPDLTAVSIPATVTHIGRNAFTYCPNLETLLFGASDIPFTQRNHVMPGADESMAIYVPATSYGVYNDLLSAYQPVYARIESIASSRFVMNTPIDHIELAINPMHPNINTEFSIESADSGISPIEVTAAEVTDGKLLLTVAATGSGTAHYLIRSAQPDVEPALIEITTNDIAGVTDINADCSDNNEKLYDLQGRRTDTHSGFRIVITNGRAKVIKY